VNAAIVSRYLNDDPYLSVRQETKDKIKKAVKELDYKPNLVARALRSNTMRNIAVLVSDISNPFFGHLFKGAQKAAHNLGYSLTLYDTEEDTEKEKKYVDMVARSLSDGILLASAYIDDATIREIEKRGLSYILVNRSSRDHSGMFVTVDDAKGIRLAVRHLYDQGHRKIAHITGPLYTTCGINRLGAYREAVMSLGLECPPGYIMESSFLSEAGKGAMENILALPYRPTAIVAGNDLIAIGAMSAIHEAGLKVPEDISVVGFDDIWLSGFTAPALTTVSYDKAELGSRAISLLVDAIENKWSANPRTEVIDVSLLVRESVKEC
jgi:DNA-binding LacI/PurR family transcriptional regulator